MKHVELDFQVMTRRFAAEIAGWRYEPPYDIYGYGEEDIDQTLDYLMDEKSGFYAVLRKEELVGFRSFGPDGRVDGGNYDESYMDTGGGIRPDLTGMGLGSNIILAGLNFGRRHLGTNRFRVTIADFNQRAIRACEKAGFLATDRFLRSCDGLPFTIFTIELE